MSRREWEINKQKKTWKILNIWKLENILLNKSKKKSQGIQKNVYWMIVKTQHVTFYGIHRKQCIGHSGAERRGGGGSQAASQVGMRSGEGCSLFPPTPSPSLSGVSPSPPPVAQPAELSPVARAQGGPGHLSSPHHHHQGQPELQGSKGRRDHQEGHQGGRRCFPG